jgi:3-methylfumaryl-CoA hydratase
MSVTLDRDEPMLKEGDPIPPAWHHAFFPRLPLTRALGPDGTIRVELWPDDPRLPRRMFLSSRTQYHRPLCIGDKMRWVTELVGLKARDARSGKCVIHSYRHTLSNAQGVAIVEEWDSMDREEVKGRPNVQPAGEPAPADCAFEKIVVPNSIMLFRYSAVTWNPHKIHYDHPYTTQVEGYPALLLHGPLTATLLSDLARDHTSGTMTRFEMRAKLPLFVDRPVKLMGRPRADNRHVCDLWAVSPEGKVAMEATATFD